MARVARGEIDVDPELLLKAIASDASAPAAARVAAARALLNHERLRPPPEQEVPNGTRPEQTHDPIKRAALKLLNGGQKQC